MHKEGRAEREGVRADKEDYYAEYVLHHCMVCVWRSVHHRVIRQKCIVQNGVNWEDDFKFLDEIRNINEKCYQTW